MSAGKKDTGLGQHERYNYEKHPSSLEVAIWRYPRISQVSTMRPLCHSIALKVGRFVKNIHEMNRGKFLNL